jgi:hypothetical protein
MPTVSLVCVSDCTKFASFERMVNSARPVISEVILLGQTRNAKTFREFAALADFAEQVTPKGNADPDRDYAYSLATKDWILALDDDEHLPSDTVDYIGRIILSKADCVWFNFQNLVDGVDIHDILGDDPHPRLWRRAPGLIQWPPQAHTFPQINSPRQIFTKNTVIHDRKFEDLEARQNARGEVIDPQMRELQMRFLAAVKQKLGKK